MAGLLSRLLRRSEPVETRDALARMHGYMPSLAGFPDPAVRQLSPVAAENLAAVMAAVNAISSSVANLAPLAFRRQGAGREELPPGHWLARLMRAPSTRFSYPEWAEQVVADCLLHGNALCEVVSDAGGRVVALEPIGWRRVSVSVLPSGRIAYDIAEDLPRRDPSRVRRLLDGEVLHLRDRTDAGEIVARSRLARAAGAVQNIAELQTMALAVWQNAAQISGYISAPTVLSRELRQEADALLEKFRGARRAGRTPLLESGWKWESISIDAEAAQALESRKFSVFEICRVFQIPPPLLQSYEFNSYTNAEQASRWYGQHTIAPWARKLEAAIGRCVLGAGSDLSVELDLSSLLKGSELERLQAHKLAVEIGAVDPGEVRQELGWGPRRPADRPPQEEPAG